jgi:hypothetical protein
MNFRNWCQEMWYQHLDEHMVMGLEMPKYDSTVYFRLYKFWLKREYRHQHGANSNSH